MELTIVTARGYVRFSVPDEWQVLSAQTRPPVPIMTFQVENPADDGTPHSTNVSVSLLDASTEQGKLAMSRIGKRYGPVAPTVSKQGDWTMYSQRAEQQGATYTIVDSVREVADVSVSVRFAWPSLPKNPENYDAAMYAAMLAFQHSVNGGLGVPPSRPGEVIRRPLQ